MIGLAIGFLNGLTIVLFRLSPIIVTLAMAGLLEGISLIFSDGAPIGGSPPVLRWFVSGRLLGIAPIGWFLIAFAIAATIFLNRTAFGRRLYAVGNSVTVARLSGVWTGSVIVGAYMLSGFCSALVGVFLSGFSGQAFFGMGDPYLLQSIAVVVLGGTLITGGRGHFVGILGGALLFTALGSLLTGDDAARGGAQYHLWASPSRRYRRAPRARGCMTRSESARMHDMRRKYTDA